MGIKVWIMKGEVWKEIFLPCWNGQDGLLRWSWTDACFEMKWGNEGNSGRGHELSNGMFGIKSVHEDGMF
jgi:hypothetical protein